MKQLLSFAKISKRQKSTQMSAFFHESIKMQKHNMDNGD
jgi:hypothetical protein